MQILAAPLRQGSTGDEVKNLHYCLYFIKNNINNNDFTNLYENVNFRQPYIGEVNANSYGQATTQLVVAFQTILNVPAELPLGSVDLPTMVEINKDLNQFNGLGIAIPDGFNDYLNGIASADEFNVSGYVVNSLGEKIGGQLLIAYDVDLKGARFYRTAKTIFDFAGNGGVQPLNIGTSDGSGFYSLSIPGAAFQQNEFSQNDTPDVIVLSIQSATTDLPEIQKSNTPITGRSALSVRNNFAGNVLLNWNVVIEVGSIRGQTEYSLISGIVSPFLQTNQTGLIDLRGSADQINFLATETGQELSNITQLVVAGGLLADAPVLEQSMELDKPLEFLYGLCRQSPNLDWAAISKISIIDIAAYIQKSGDANIISILDPRELPDFAKSLHDFAVQKNLDNSSSQQNGIKNVLSIALKDDTASMQTFYQAYINRTSTPQEFWDTLRQDPDFKDQVDPLLLTNSLSALTGNNVTVMQKLAQKTENNDVSKLLALSIPDWDALIGADVPDLFPGITAAIYREYMRGILHAAHPNEKVSMMVQNQSDSGIEDSDVRDALNKFLTSTNFDLRLNRLMDQPDPNSADTFQTKLDELGGDKKTDVKKALNRIQRVFQFSPSPDIMTKLLQRGIDSATMVASMPYNTFKTNYQDIADEPTLLAIHQRASHIVSMIEYSILSLNRFTKSAGIPAITGQNNS